MATVTSELVTEFSFIGSLMPLEQFNKSMGASIKVMAGVAAAMGAAAAATLSWADSNIQAQKEVANLSELSGISMQRISDLGFVAAATGSDMDTLVGTVDSLTAALSDEKLQGNDAFAMLINTQGLKDADDVLMAIRERFAGGEIPDAIRQSLVGNLGIPPDLLNFLELSEEKFRALIEESRSFGVMTKEQEKQILDYTRNVEKLGVGWDRVKNLMAVGLAPALTEISDGFSEFIKENGELISTIAQGTIKVVSELGGVLKRLGPILLALAAPFAIFAVITSPILITTAIIGALVLIIDDLLVALNGGDSVIGDFLKAFDVDISETVSALKVFYEIFKETAGIAWDGIVDGINAVTGAIKAMREQIPEFDKTMETLEKFAKGGVLGVFDISPGDYLAEKGSNILNNLKTIAQVRSGTVGGPVNIEQKNTININGGDTESIGKRTESALQNNMRDAQIQLERVSGD